MVNPLLSIIIPTKDRYSTLFPVVDMILAYNLNSQIEIVIQDNSTDNEEAQNFIQSKLGFKNLKYFYEASPLSVIANSDKAVLNSTGDYICFIGDDDGVMPNIVAVTKWMKENGFKVLKSYKPDYYWPGQKSNYFDGHTSGVLQFVKWKSTSFSIMSTRKGLENTLSKGGNSIRLLPCLYHGIVKRCVLDLIYEKAGSYFPGPSPDMANAVALTQVIDYFVYVNYPVCITGKSNKSTGGAGVLHQHVSTIDNVNHLPSETSKNWDTRIPKYWTGPTIWAESVLKALEKFGNRIDIQEFNFTYLYAWLGVFHRRDLSVILKGFPLVKDWKYYLYFYSILFYRVQVFLQNRFIKKVKIHNVENIKDAVSILKEVSY